MKFVEVEDHFTIDVENAGALEIKRLQFIQMMDECYAIGYMSVIGIEFEDEAVHAYIRVSITGTPFNIKAVLVDGTETLNGMLRYSHSLAAKTVVNDWIRSAINKQRKSEK